MLWRAPAVGEQAPEVAEHLNAHGEDKDLRCLPQTLHRQLHEKRAQDAAGQNQVDHQIRQQLFPLFRDNVPPAKQNTQSHQNKQLAYQKKLRA